MSNHQLNKRLAIGTLIWSVVVGAGCLFGLRLIQITMGEGHAGAFPIEPVAFYAGVEVLLGLVFVGILRQRSWVAAALAVLLAAAVMVTIVCTRNPNFAPDLMANMLFIEAIWLGPWLLTMWRLWSRPS